MSSNRRAFVTNLFIERVTQNIFIYLFISRSLILLSCKSLKNIKVYDYAIELSLSHLTSESTDKTTKFN